MSDHLMIAAGAAAFGIEHDRMALATGLVRPGRTITDPDGCTATRHGADCDCFWDGGED